MATTLLTTFNRTDTYPKYISVTAPSNCGTVTIMLGDDFTEQMSYELPSINIDIYTIVNGKKCLYRERALVIHTEKKVPNKTYMLLDIPQTCEFAITPMFDNSALNSHNEMVEVFNAIPTKWKTTEQNIPKRYEAQEGYIYPILPASDDEDWEESTSTFNLSLVWDNTNINSSGGSGGSSPTPPTPSTLPPTLYYGIIDTNTIQSLTELDEYEITDDEFSITFTKNIDNQYQVIAYETGYYDIISITSGVDVLGTFNESKETFGDKTYKVLISENRLTFNSITNPITYVIKF